MYIIENSGNLINSLNPISLNNMKLNNGYHVFELPRSQELLNFMMKKIKIKFNYFNNKQKAQYALFIFGVWGHLPNAD